MKFTKWPIRFLIYQSSLHQSQRRWFCLFS
ncbi:hypothetical protein LINPERPRIM_LOCUS1982 [Linum perenne]